MHILLSNDDGYLAPGLQTLARYLANEHEVTVVAPDRKGSGASNSLTLELPIRAVTHDNGFISVDGTPTDCVHLAITGLLDKEPDMVISGINAGANMGDDVLYSGTVAAATEGRFLGLPAIAVSLASHSPNMNYEPAAKVVVALVKKLANTSLPKNTILNVNVPEGEFIDLDNIEVTRLGNRHRSEPVIKAQDPRGKTVYWVGPPGAEQDAGPGTDFNAINEGRVSITPIHTDLTQHAAITNIKQWLGDVG